jgi:hypothetical integral membrane protein (TIGR02206 family)
MALTQAAGFTPYGAAHLGAVTVLLLGAAVLVAVGRRRRDTDPDDVVGRGLAVAMLVVMVLLHVLYLAAEGWDHPLSTLPIQLCDLAWPVAAYALWTGRRRPCALTYYWGLTLTTQAVLTPVLDVGFPHPAFLLFWGMHVGTVWAAAYLTWGRGVTPDWRGFRFAVAATATWAVAVFALNLAVGTNYGFLNRKPAATTVLDLLGPWPWYVLAEVAIVVAAWALVTWPWVRSRGRTGRATSPGGTVVRWTTRPGGSPPGSGRRGWR